MNYTLIKGDVLDALKAVTTGSVNCCVTSPPYYNLRDFGFPEQIGLEKTPAEYVAKIVAVFEEVRRVLREDGTLWLNIGDTYNVGLQGQSPLSRRRDKAQVTFTGREPVPGVKPKNLIGIPWLVALALRDAGWNLRAEIIWHKPTPLPLAPKDRPVLAHEPIYLMSKSLAYYYDADAIREKTGREMSWEQYRATTGKGKDWINEKKTLIKGCCGMRNRPMRAGVHPMGRNKRSVWKVATESHGGEHYAAYPVALITPCILAGCPKGGTVLDPFCGTGSTGVAALNHDRKFIGIDGKEGYLAIARRRLSAPHKPYRAPNGAPTPLFGEEKNAEQEKEPVRLGLADARFGQNLVAGGTADRHASRDVAQGAATGLCPQTDLRVQVFAGGKGGEVQRVAGRGARRDPAAEESIEP